MAAARRVLQEGLGSCTQKDLLARRHSWLTAPVGSTRKSDLIADWAAQTGCVSYRQRTRADLMAAWSKY
eukprot:4256689-Lingulodinium_polyedra.AAC.1